MVMPLRAARRADLSGWASRRMGSATWLIWCAARQGWSRVRWTTVFSPGMSDARTMVYSCQGISGEKVMSRMEPRAMVERMVQPGHLPGRVRASVYCAAPRTLARPCLRRGDAPMMEVLWGMNLEEAGFGVSDEDSTRGGCGATGGMALAEN